MNDFASFYIGFVLVIACAAILVLYTARDVIIDIMQSIKNGNKCKSSFSISKKGIVFTFEARSNN